MSITKILILDTLLLDACYLQVLIVVSSCPAQGGQQELVTVAVVITHFQVGWACSRARDYLQRQARRREVTTPPLG